MIIELTNYSRGVTTGRRTEPGTSAFIKHLDGYQVENGAAVPLRGMATHSVEVGPDADVLVFWRQSNQSQYLLALAEDAAKLLQIYSSGNSWIDGPDISGVTYSKPARVGTHLFIPQEGGMLTLDLAVVTAPTWITSNAYALGEIARTESTTYAYRCISAHTSGATTEPETGADWETKWERIIMLTKVGLPIPEVTPSIVSVGRASGTALVHACDTDWSDGVGMPGTVTRSVSSKYTIEGTGALEFAFSGGVPDADTGEHLAETTALETTDFSDHTHIVCSIFWTGSDPLVSTVSSKISGLNFVFYNGATEVGIANVPPLQPGWNRCVMKLRLTSGANWESVSKVSLWLHKWPHLSTTSPAFYIDELYLSTVEHLGEWNQIQYADLEQICLRYPLYAYSYRLCWEAPESFTDAGSDAIISSPSDEVHTMLVGPGDRVQITCTPPTFTDHNVKRVAYYRSYFGVAGFEYAGSAEIASPTLTDDGGVGDYTARDLPRYAEYNHTEPRIAKFVMSADGCLYAACLDYADGKWKSPMEIARSTYTKPHYWPTAPTADDIISGSRFEVPAITGSEIRAIGMWTWQKLVLLDTECFLMAGDNVANTSFTYLGPVGCRSHRTYAANDKMAIWLSGDGFVSYRDGVITNISKDKVNLDGLETDNAVYPHSAAIVGDLYVATFYQNDNAQSRYLCLIYDIALGCWTTYWDTHVTLDSAWSAGGRPGPRVLAMAADQDSNSVHAIAQTGADSRAVQLLFPYLASYRPVYTWTTDGTNERQALYTLETQQVTCIIPGSDDSLISLYLDIEPNPAGVCTLSVTVRAYGKDGTETQTETLTLVAGICQYEFPLGDHLMGRTLDVKLQTRTANPPTIHGIAITTTGKKQR